MILRTYLVKEQIAPFLFSFSVIMFLLVLDTILQQIDMILGRGVSWEVAAELFFLHIAWQVALAIPMSVLAGSLMAFGRLSGDNEIVAMRTLGVSVSGLILPALAAASVLAALLVFFNDQILPGFNHRARLLTMDIKRKRPTVAFQDRAGVLIDDFRDYHILIGSVDDSSGLEDVLIYKYEPTGYPLTLTAKKGRIDFAGESDEVFLTLIDGEVHRLDESNPEVFVAGDFNKLTLRLGNGGRHLSRTVSGYRNDREMGIGMMWERVRNYETTADSLRSSATTAFGGFAERAIFRSAGEGIEKGEKPGRGDPLDLRRASGRLASDIFLALIGSCLMAGLARRGR
jgi:lipopolysaccharide export system permease protein